MEVAAPATGFEVLQHHVHGEVGGHFFNREALFDHSPLRLAGRLLERGVLVAPGTYLGASGEGYVRYALVPTEKECVRAVSILEDAL